MKYFALVDCNNFYASCERSFNPHLQDRPIVVLSNNDGCVIARSEEAKALGIPMGIPYWEVRDLIKREKVKVFSSNYQLYGDMSNRVMNILRAHSSDMEVYSIDEAFLELAFFDQSQASLFDYGCKLRQKVMKGTGIAVSVGIGATKTLSKLANHIAKKQQGVYVLNPNDPMLSGIPTEKIWGVGSAYKRRLKKIDVHTVAQLQAVDESWMRKEFGVVGLRLLKELKGTTCQKLEPPITEKKEMMVSRAFRRDVYELSELLEAISVYATRLGEKLRQYKQSTGMLTVFLWANPFRNQRKDGRKYFAQSIELPLHTNNTNELIEWSAKVIKFLFERGTNYKKAGIMASQLKPANILQTNLFVPADKLQKSKRIMQAVDKINTQMGRNTVYFSSCGRQQGWARKEQWSSPRYTTRWEELLRISSKSGSL